MIVFHVTHEENGWISKRGLNNAMRKGHDQAGKFWHRTLLPLHFTKRAKFKYGHRPRQRAYVKRKEALARKGLPFRRGGQPIQGDGRIDNVLTGFMRDALTGIGIVRAFPTRTSINMTGPRYITMRPYKSNQPDKAREILRVTDQEEQRIAGVFDTAMTRELKLDRSRKKVKVA